MTRARAVSNHAAVSSRRRVLLVGTSALVFLATVPIFGHHLQLAAALPLAHMERIGAVCLVALHLTLGPLHTLSHVLLFMGLSYAVFDRARAWYDARRTLAGIELHAPSSGSRVFAAAVAAGFDPRRVAVARRLPNPAFTLGLVRPRVYLSAAFVGSLDDDELRCVLAHEAAHGRRYDPLRLTVLRFLAVTLFWLPALRRLSDDIVAETEFEADAAAAGGEPLRLASALIAAARLAGPGSVPAAACAAGDRDLLELRVRRLAGEPVTPASRVSRRSILAAAAALLITWTSGAVVAHPLDLQTAAVNSHSDCTSHPGLPLLHLFCAHFVPGGLHCRHAAHLAAHHSHG